MVILKKMTNCIECEDGMKCMSDDALICLTEEELDNYLNCNESVFKLNQVKGQQIDTERIRILTS